ncbi:MAG: hypothetical protein K2Q10_00085, partial [Rhodospirillales bacterium]|nr:hypothetical protein [Rhodospirillales bacterium]
MTEPLLRLRLGERVAWARDLDIAIPAGLAATLDDRNRTTAAHQALHLRAAFTNSPPSSSRLPFSYQSVPSWMRSLVAMAIGRLRRRQ